MKQTKRNQVHHHHHLLLPPGPRAVSTRSNESGFSLTELLIVLAILSVIAAISIPMIQAHLDGVRENKTIARLSNIGAAANTFRTTMGKRRYPTLDELRQKLPGQNNPLISPLDAPTDPVDGWAIEQIGAPTTDAMCVIAYKVGYRPEGPSRNITPYYEVLEDGVVRQVLTGVICDRTAKPVLK